jgi:hypothetical protein
MASKGVRSSHAISTILEIWSTEKLYFLISDNLLPNLRYFPFYELNKDWYQCDTKCLVD